ncbi:hypothetical protein [Planobispora takensis]|uniref:WD40 repeat domain-containing protein n=1 Tax=Planobispora takensis TaxID=1367882 RepID=A0A8J3T4H8_9ACTN|nr:hypothetical protein [Planobispora takensis]GII05061.1 hypothetical protein Pta02_70690 [Planobispora takensis]
MPVISGIRRSLRAAAVAATVTAVAAASLPAAAGTAPRVAAPVPIKLPGTGVTVYEDVADPVRVTSYTVGREAYLRRGASFLRRSGDSEVTVAPKGVRALGVAASYTSGYDSVNLFDVATGKGNRIRTVRKPLVADLARWARDGSKAVLTVRRKAGTRWETTGFVVVNATARSARAVTVRDVDASAVFRWSPGGAELMAGHAGGVRFYAPDGTVRSTATGTGTPAGGEDAFSPSGRRVSTWCPPSYAEHVCVWNRTDGRLETRVNIRPESLWGWWDDDHLIAVVAHGAARRAVLADLRGGTVRVLADIPAADWGKKIYLSYTRK